MTDPLLSAHLRAIGSRGGLAAARGMTAKARKERAKKAAIALWSKKKHDASALLSAFSKQSE